MLNPVLLLTFMTELRSGEYVPYDQVQSLLLNLRRHIIDTQGSMIEKKVAYFLYEMTNIINDRLNAEIDKSYIQKIYDLWQEFSAEVTEFLWQD